METREIESAIERSIPQARVFLEGEGCNFYAIVISSRFAGLTPVKRQQKVLAPVTEWLTTGALHAFSVKTYTPEEWAQHQAATAAGLVPIQ